MQSKELEIIPYPLFSGDSRGWVVRPIYNALRDFTELGDDEGLGDVSNLHIVSMLPGAVRGEHLHKNQLEFLLIMGGEVEVAWQNSDQSEKQHQRLDTRKPVLLRVPPNIMHAIRNISNETVFVVCYSKAFGAFPGQDVFKTPGYFDEAFKASEND